MSAQEKDPLDVILNSNDEDAGDTGNSTTPELSPGLLNTASTNKIFELFQNFMSSQGHVVENTATTSAGSSSTPDNTNIRTEPVPGNVGDTPKDKFTEDLEQDYKKVILKGPPIDQRLASIFQDLAWGIFKQEKWDQVANDTLPPENIDSLEVTKVNKEVWSKISHSTKSFDLTFQKLQDLILKSFCITSTVANELYLARSGSKEDLVGAVNSAVRKCADTAMLLGKLNYDLLACRREMIIPELNSSYRQLTFVQGDHPKLLFGDDLPKAIKDISETNKVGQAIKKHIFSPVNHTASYHSQPSNFSPRGKNSFLHRGRGKRGRIRPQSFRNNPYQNNRGSYRH